VTAWPCTAPSTRRASPASCRAGQVGCELQLEGYGVGWGGAAGGLTVAAGAGVNIDIYRSPYGVIALMLVMLAVLALSARHLIELLPFFLRKIQNKYLWMVVSLGFYTCSISGLVFDIIRGPPPFYLNQVHTASLLDDTSLTKPDENWGFRVGVGGCSKRGRSCSSTPSRGSSSWWRASSSASSTSRVP
jgi:hypothetical protein